MHKEIRSVFSICVLVVIYFVATASFADVRTVEEQEPRYKISTKPSEKVFLQKKDSKDALVSDMMVGLAQGVDTNPLLDSTKKADNFTQEMLDMHFRYPICKTGPGDTISKFGFNITNIGYWEETDVSIFDGLADARLEHKFLDKYTLSAGYQFELLWFPNNRPGNYLGNEINFGLRQDINKRVYQKASYRLIFRNYPERKARLGNANLSSDLRADMRNVFEHELGIYLTDKTKLKIVNQLYQNDSNDQYFDFYNYLNYRVGGSIVQLFTKKLYNITGFYYQRRNYDSRIVSDKDVKQRDNMYTVSSSFLFDVTKKASVFLSVSHAENQTNEPLERYADTLVSGGLYYSF